MIVMINLGRLGLASRFMLAASVSSSVFGDSAVSIALGFVGGCLFRSSISI